MKDLIENVPLIFVLIVDETGRTVYLCDIYFQTKILIRGTIIKVKDFEGILRRKI